ncbi:aldehyde dehydrogenase family protein [Ureibacillus acetophenoni]
MNGNIQEEAGLPDGFVHLLYGSGSKLGEIFVSDPRIAKFTFTGSQLEQLENWLKKTLVLEVFP